jgi:hypothetical protein
MATLKAAVELKKVAQARKQVLLKSAARYIHARASGDAAMQKEAALGVTAAMSLKG